MRNNRSHPAFLRHLNSTQGLAHGADLIHFYENRIGIAPLNPFLDIMLVRHKKIIPYDLHR
jgi:hypothetical protein